MLFRSTLPGSRRCNYLLLRLRRGAFVINFLSFHCFIYNNNYYLISITESWLKDTVNNGLIDPNVVTILLGVIEIVEAGVCILLLRSLDYIVYDSDLFSDLELLCVDIVICRINETVIK